MRDSGRLCGQVFHNRDTTEGRTLQERYVPELRYIFRRFFLSPFFTQQSSLLAAGHIGRRVSGLGLTWDKTIKPSDLGLTLGTMFRVYN